MHCCSGAEVEGSEVACSDAQRGDPNTAEGKENTLFEKLSETPSHSLTLMSSFHIDPCVLM